MKKSILVAIFFLLGCNALRAQPRQTREEYIDRYKSIAVAHMERYGIPASITMAQGILESDCGNSPLSRSSNNHFGIKCKRDWTGSRVFHDDHARFLDSQPRYDSLFVYPADDYRSWARGLKAAGYATAPDYAQRLCRIIEENQLHLLDLPQGEVLYAARNRSRAEQAVAGFEGESSVNRLAPATDERVDPDNYRVTINAYKGYNIYVTNGVNYVVAKEGDTFESLATIFCISARNLRKFNDLKGRVQPVRGEQIYIDRKKKRWEGNARHHIVTEGETVASIAQSYALREKSLRRLNRLKTGAALQTAQTIRIQ